MGRDLTIISDASVPKLVRYAGEGAQIRFLELFAAQIRNSHAHRAYGCAVGDFLARCEGRGVRTLVAVRPLHVAGYNSHIVVRAVPTPVKT